MGAPELCRQGDALTWLWREEGYRVTLDRFTERFGTLHAELLIESIQTDRNGHSGHVHWSSLALASTADREAIKRKLNGQDARVQWGTILELSCLWAARIQREGEPMVDVSERSGDVIPRQFIMRKLVPRAETSLIYGDGASGKSLLCQALALACQMGISLPGRLTCDMPVQVIYYDWETSADVIQRRLNRICSGWMVDVPRLRYVPMRRPLADGIARIRADVDRVKAGLVIIDSVGFAASGNLNDQEAATRLLNDLRTLETTVLAVHHLSKAAAEHDSGPSKPFGSGYFHNGARNAWEVRSRQDGDELVMSLWQRKDNDGGGSPRPTGLMFQFTGEDGPIRIVGADIESDPALIAHGGLPFHLKSLLRSGSLTVALTWRSPSGFIARG